MTDELQNDEPILTGNIDAGTEEAQEADLAPATGDDQSESEQKTEAENKNSEKLSDGAIKAINKQHFKYQEEKRKAEALAKEKAEIEARLRELESARGEVVIPPIPDPYDFVSDEEYRAEIQKREDAIRQKAINDAKKEVEQLRLQEAEKQKQDEVKHKQQALLKSYVDNATALRIDIEELSAAENVVNMYNIDQQVSEFVMKDKDGPLMVQYLAKNPIVLDEISRMSAIDAVLKINSEVKSAVSQMKPSLSAAPPPPETLDGVGAPETMNPLIAGGKFE